MYMYVYKMVLNSCGECWQIFSLTVTFPYLTSPHLTSPHLTSPHLTLPYLTRQKPCLLHGSGETNCYELYQCNYWFCILKRSLWHRRTQRVSSCNAKISVSVNKQYKSYLVVFGKEFKINFWHWTSHFVPRGYSCQFWIDVCYKGSLKNLDPN